MAVSNMAVKAIAKIQCYLQPEIFFHNKQNKKPGLEKPGHM